jgi:hypothetical protein
LSRRCDTLIIDDGPSMGLGVVLEINRPGSTVIRRIERVARHSPSRHDPLLRKLVRVIADRYPPSTCPPTQRRRPIPEPQPSVRLNRPSSTHTPHPQQHRTPRASTTGPIPPRIPITPIAPYRPIHYQHSRIDRHPTSSMSSPSIVRNSTASSRPQPHRLLHQPVRLVRRPHLTLPSPSRIARTRRTARHPSYRSRHDLSRLVVRFTVHPKVRPLVPSSQTPRTHINHPAHLHIQRVPHIQHQPTLQPQRVRYRTSRFYRHSV